MKFFGRSACQVGHAGLQDYLVRGFDVLGTALVLIPQGVGSLLTRTVPGRWPGHERWRLGAVLLVRGLGLGVVLIPVMTVAFADIDPDDMPEASLLTRTSQQVGGSFGSPPSCATYPPRKRRPLAIFSRSPASTSPRTCPHSSGSMVASAKGLVAGASRLTPSAGDSMLLPAACLAVRNASSLL